MPKFLSIFEKFIFILILAVLVAVPLYPKFPLFNVSGTFAAIRAEDLLILITYLFWAGYVFISGKLKSMINNNLFQALVLFYFIGLVSALSSIFLLHTTSPHLAVLHFLRRIEYVTILLVPLTVIKTKKQINLVLIILSLVVLAVVLYAFGQKYLDFPVISTTNSEFARGQILYLNTSAGARVNSTFAGHYDLAVFLAMVLVVFAAIFLVIKKIYYKIWVLLLSILSFIVLIMTASRLSYLVAIIGIILALIFTGRKLLILVIIVASVAVLVYPSQLRDRLISTISVNLLNGGQRYIAPPKEQLKNQLNIPTLPKAASLSAGLASGSAFLNQPADRAPDIVPGEPLDTTDLGVYRSFEIRLNDEWPRALNAFFKNPFLGTGYSSLGLATDNDILRSLGEAGLLGTLAFILIIINITKLLVKNMKSQSKFYSALSAGFLAMVIGFILNGLVIDVFEASKIAILFWLTLGVVIAMRKDIDNLQND